MLFVFDSTARGLPSPLLTKTQTQNTPPSQQHRISLGGLLPTPSSSPPPSPTITRAASTDPPSTAAAEPSDGGSAPLTRPQPIRPQLSSSLSSSRLGPSLGAAAASSYFAVFGRGGAGGGPRSRRGGSVDFGGAAETLKSLPEPGLSGATTVVVVMNAREALTALEALAAFAWGDDGDMGLWPDAAAVVAGLGPRLLEAPGVEEDGDAGGGADTMAMDGASSAALLFRLRVAGAVGRALPRFASVAAAAMAAAAATANTADAGDDNDDEEEQQHEQQQRRRLAMLRASVQGALQALLNAALSEARREGRQALFASALLVGDSGGEESDGLVVVAGEEGGGAGAGGGGCLDPFLAAPGPVGVLLQAARDEDLEVGARIGY